MRNYSTYIRTLLFAGTLSFAACEHEKVATPEPAPVNTRTDTIINTLVYTKTNGYRHESIPAGIEMFETNAGKWKLRVHNTEARLTAADLDTCELLVLLSNTGEVFNEEEETALQNYVHGGGRILAIHSASDAEYSWPWYHKLIGASFKDHPAIQQARSILQESAHPSAMGLPINWIRTDEWYNFKDLQSDINVVYNLDETTYSGGTHGATHPISWYHEFEGGRVFYTAMGHTSSSYTEPLFVQHIGGAIVWLTKE
jgi:type 1 glutamine amidotransferase